MKDASEAGLNMSVADWKPCTREEFDRLLHHYATTGGDEHGNDGITPKAYRLDKHAKAVVWTLWRTERSIGSPVLMTMTHADSHAPLTFVSLRYGLNAPAHLAYRTPEGVLTELGAGRAPPEMPQDSSDPDTFTSARIKAMEARHVLSGMELEKFRSEIPDRRVPPYADEQRPKGPRTTTAGGEGMRPPTPTR